jgi:hypothetical protein
VAHLLSRASIAVVNSGGGGETSGLGGGVKATGALDSGGVIANAVAPAEAVMMLVVVAGGSLPRTRVITSLNGRELLVMVDVISVEGVVVVVVIIVVVVVAVIVVFTGGIIIVVVITKEVEGPHSHRSS